MVPMTAAPDPSTLADVETPCRGKPVEWFFPTHGGLTPEAVVLCGACSVRAWCAEVGRDEPDGIWGGISEEERRPRRRRNLRSRGRPCVTCGTRFISSTRLRYCSDACFHTRRLRLKAESRRRTA